MYKLSERTSVVISFCWRQRSVWSRTANLSRTFVSPGRYGRHGMGSGASNFRAISMHRGRIPDTSAKMHNRELHPAHTHHRRTGHLLQSRKAAAIQLGPLVSSPFQPEGSVSAARGFAGSDPNDSTKVVKLKAHALVLEPDHPLYVVDHAVPRSGIKVNRISVSRIFLRSKSSLAGT